MRGALLTPRESTARESEKRSFPLALEFFFSRGKFSKNRLTHARIYTLLLWQAQQVNGLHGKSVRFRFSNRHTCGVLWVEGTCMHPQKKKKGSLVQSRHRNVSEHHVCGNLMPKSFYFIYIGTFLIWTTHKECVVSSTVSSNLNATVTYLTLSRRARWATRKKCILYCRDNRTTLYSTRCESLNCPARDC
jgi:hypothetical protein